MMLLALALAQAAPAADMPDLRAALINYQVLAGQMQCDARGANCVAVAAPAYLSLATTNVCRIALRYTVLRNDQSAADAIIGYRGPRSDELKLSCSVYFQAAAR